MGVIPQLCLTRASGRAECILLTCYGITIDNRVIAISDVEISREDGGLIVHEISTGGHTSSGVSIWPT